MSEEQLSLFMAGAMTMLIVIALVLLVRTMLASYRDRFLEVHNRISKLHDTSRDDYWKLSHRIDALEKKP